MTGFQNLQQMFQGFMTAEEDYKLQSNNIEERLNVVDNDLFQQVFSEL